MVHVIQDDNICPAQKAKSPEESGIKLPKLSVFQLLNLCMGIIGIQFAWSMQIALSSRVLEPLGASPFIFGLIWCAGPITGLLVQPIVGALSDRTWTKLGRRRPFILVGAGLGSVALLAFPFAPTLLIAALLIWIIDACVNVSQGPYRALVPDNVPAEQHAVANSYLNCAFGAGSVISLAVAPILKMFDIPMSIQQQYIMSAAALILFILYTAFTIKEYAKPKEVLEQKKNESFASSFKKFLTCNREIHKICGVQFLTWVGIMCMFIYLTPFIVHNIYQLPDMSTPYYKSVEATHNIIMPMAEKISKSPVVLVSASNELNNLKKDVGQNKTDDNLVKNLLFSVADQPILEKLTDSTLISSINQDLTKYNNFNTKIDSILAGIVVNASDYGSSEKQKLQELAVLTPEHKTLTDRIAEINSESSDKSVKAFERFKNLVSNDKAVGKMVDLSQLAQTGNPDGLLSLSMKYQELIKLKRLTEIKSLLIQQNLLAADFGIKNQQNIDKSVLVDFKNLEKFSLLKKIGLEATNTAQLALVAFNFVTLILSIPLGYLCTRFSKKLIYSLCLGFLSIAFAFAPFLSAPYQVIIMMACAGVAWATILSIPFAFLCDYMPEGEEGSLMGIFNMFIAGPQLISATVIGWIISKSPITTAFGMAHDWSIAFVVASVFVGLSIIALQFVKEKKTGLCVSVSSGGH